IALATMKFRIGEVTVSFSSLLVCMMLGTVFCNVSEFSEDIFTRCDKWTVPLYAIFFVISGAQLDLGVLGKPVMILVGVVYILFRSLGKYFGARISSSACHCSEDVRKYLGITLLPQAGVALGMVITAQALGQSCGALVRNIVLFSVLVYELVGPLLTKQALMAAGEVETKASDEQHRARFKKKAAVGA
ncbi:MAG: sodium:proton antiporter, partial [Clostridia bacterium]|nr:sodium:proton antiporter [Clostridia bacterium]